MTDKQDTLRWRLLYAGVLLFLILQIALYAWFTEAWK